MTAKRACSVSTALTVAMSILAPATGAAAQGGDPLALTDAASRRALWARLLPARPHLTVDERELDDIAQRFELTGGNIRNVVLDACLRALAGDDSQVTLRHVIASIAREYQKTSRPVTEGTFGPYYGWAMRDIVSPVESDVTAGP